MLNAELHTRHLYGSDPASIAAWPRMYASSALANVNAAQHRAHVYGRSPACVRMCSANFMTPSHCAPHMSHSRILRVRPGPCNGACVTQ